MKTRLLTHSQSRLSSSTFLNSLLSFLFIMVLAGGTTGCEGMFELDFLECSSLNEECEPEPPTCEELLNQLQNESLRFDVEPYIECSCIEGTIECSEPDLPTNECYEGEWRADEMMDCYCEAGHWECVDAPYIHPQPEPAVPCGCTDGQWSCGDEDLAVFISTDDGCFCEGDVLICEESEYSECRDGDYQEDEYETCVCEGGLWWCDGLIGDVEIEEDEREDEEDEENEGWSTWQ